MFARGRGYTRTHTGRSGVPDRGSMNSNGVAISRLVIIISAAAMRLISVARPLISDGNVFFFYSSFSWSAVVQQR